MAYKVNGNFNNPGEYTTAGSLWVALEGPDPFGFNSSLPVSIPIAIPARPYPASLYPNHPTAENDINHNTVDSNYVVVTGVGGSRAVFAVGELDPKFAPTGYAATITCDKHGRCNLAGEGRAVRERL